MGWRVEDVGGGELHPSTNREPLSVLLDAERESDSSPPRSPPLPSPLPDRRRHRQIVAAPLPPASARPPAPDALPCRTNAAAVRMASSYKGPTPQLGVTVEGLGAAGPVQVVAAADLPEVDFRKALESALFRRWLESLHAEKGLLAHGKLTYGGSSSKGWTCSGSAWGSSSRHRRRGDQTKGRAQVLVQMLSELRTSTLSLRKYYELYRRAFDEMRKMEMFLREEDRSGQLLRG